MSQNCPRMFSALFQFLTGEHGLASSTSSRTQPTPDHTVCVHVHGGGDESACKPDSVPVARERPSICDCRCRQPDAAHPRTWAGSPQTFAQPMPGTDLLALLQVGFTEPPGSPRTLVVSYTTVSPLPPKGGGLFSVALSRGSLRMGVTHHPALWSPDFPRHLADPAAARSTRS